MNPVACLNWREDGLSGGLGFSLANGNTVWIIPVRGYSFARVQARKTMLSAGWTTATATIKQSANGVKGEDFGTAQLITNAAPVAGPIDLSGVKYLIVQTGATEAGVEIELEVVLSWTRTS